MPTENTTTTGTGPAGTAAAGPPAPYGLSCPDLAEVRVGIGHVYGPEAEQVWRQLLAAASLTGRETDDASLAVLLDVMSRTDPLLELCARSVLIRLRTYEQLTAVQTIIRSAS